MQNCDRKYFFGKAGRKLQVQEWGPEDKPVVLLVHGFPGCADHGKLISSSPLWNSFRLMAMDRPGYGESEVQKKLTPLRFAKQVQALMKEKGIEKFSIISVSGGAPFAMAIAYLMKDQVQKMTSLGGIAPFTWRNFKYMNTKQKQTLFLSNLIPKTVLKFAMNRVWEKGFGNLDKFFFTEAESFSPEDRKVILDPELGPELLQSIKTAFKNGPAGLLTDIYIYSKPWGFPIDQVTCPVTLWHGSADDIVHLKFAEDMDQRLPNAKLKVLDKEGHYSLLVNFRDQILADVLSPHSA